MEHTPGWPPGHDAHLRAPRSAAALALVALLTPEIAEASGELRATAVFAVARDPSGQKAAAVANARLRTRVAAERDLRLIDPGRVLSGDPRTREEETLERARAALADGRRAYDALKLDDAIARLGQAVSLYQQTGPLLGDLEELQNALLYLGAALVLRGSADEGESTFVELLTVNPTFAMDGFPPTVTQVFERALARVDGNPTGTVEIYSTPPYAAVFIDGRFEGTTPFELEGLLAGTHYLRIEKLGYTVHGAPLDVSPNQRITSQTRLRSIKRGPELRDLAARAAEEVRNEGMGGALRQITRTLVADVLLFVTVTQSGRDATFTGGVFDGATGTRIATERTVLAVEGSTFDADLDAFLDRLLVAVRTGAPAGTDPTVSSGGGEKTGGAFGLGGGGQSPSGGGGGPAPGYGAPNALATERPTPSEVYLGWTMVGVGTASIITGIVFGILATTVHGDFRDTSQLSPDLEDLQSRGKTNALISDITWIAGSAIAAGGIAILLIDANRAPSPAEVTGGPRVGVVPVDGGALMAVGGVF